MLVRHAVRYVLALSVLFVCAPLFAAEATTGPIIEDYGAAFPVEDRDVPLVDGHVYRVVFEITEYNGSPDALNRELDTVARFLNMHGKNGVPVERLQLAVVIHGAALVNVLNDASYQDRFQLDNPNLDLVRQLQGAGVQFFACGQSMAGRNFAKAELASGVKLALSAMTMVHQLQADGYTLQP
jgi:intracellular sulfur oxidation DsrE/DsrF family protein